MNINQALKEKSRIVRKLDNLYSILIEYNSIEAGNIRRYSILNTLGDINELIEELVELKTKIHRANIAVYDKIFRLSELKALVKKIKEMPVVEGKKMSMYGNSSENLEVEINARQRDGIIIDIQSEIDKLQDDLDLYNATTHI
jgi:hypothetical protein